MLRSAIRILRPVILTLALLFVFAWLLDGSKTFQNCMQPNQGQTAEHDFKNDISSVSLPFGLYRRCAGEVFEAHHNEIIAAFTVFLAIVTFFLWLATRDLVLGAEETARRQLRAYVTAKFVRVLKDDMTLKGRVEITNTGRRPLTV